MARARCHDLDPAVELDYDMTQDPTVELEPG